MSRKARQRRERAKELEARHYDVATEAIRSDAGSVTNALGKVRQITVMHGTDAERLVKLVKEDLRGMEQKIRTSKGPHASKSWERAMNKLLDNLEDIPLTDGSMAVIRAVNAMKYYTGRICASKQPEWWFSFIHDNKYAVEFALTITRMERYGGQKIATEVVEINDELVRAVQTVVTKDSTQKKKFFELIDIASELDGKDYSKLKDYVDSGNLDIAGKAINVLNEKLNQHGIAIDVETNLRRQIIDVNARHVCGIVYPAEMKVLVIEDFPWQGRAHDNSGIYSPYSDMTNVVINKATITPRDRELFDGIDKLFGQPRICLEMVDIENKRPFSEIMFHELCHRLDKLSGYIDRISRHGRDDTKTIHTNLLQGLPIEFILKELDPTGISEATAMAYGFLSSRISGDEIKERIGNFDIGCTEHKIGNTVLRMIIGSEILNDTQDRTEEIRMRLMEFLDKEYTRALGISRTELFGSLDLFF
ncbi:MAG: hypothetical protein ABII39_02990 [Candidatus Micrarchaeota archaeon]